MKKKSKLVVTLILTVLLPAYSACSAEPPSSPTPTPTFIFTKASVITPSPTSTIIYTPTVESTSTPIGTPTPFGGGSGNIAFVSDLDGDFEIYMMNIDSSEWFPLTNHAEWDCCAKWSPDGTKIAFVSTRDGNWEIYVMNADGSDQTRLTRHEAVDSSPSWSPDGEKIAFDSNRGDGSEIYIMNTDGKQLTQLTNDRRDNHAPDWSPDGTRIAYESVDYTNDPAAFEEIFVMNADGRNPVQLTKNNVQDLVPSWSPDGTRIAYVSTPSHSVDEHNWGIYVMNDDGSNPIQLTFDTSHEWSPTWSPDGSRIAFNHCSDDATSSTGQICDIYTMNPDGSNQTRITDFHSNTGIAAWLPSLQYTIKQHPDCTASWTRLEAGEQAKVSQATITPNRVRSGPSTANEIIALIHPGTVLKLLEGPICADGLIFWKVENDSIPGGVGWTAEGDGSEYWLEPYEP